MDETADPRGRKKITAWLIGLALVVTIVLGAGYASWSTRHTLETLRWVDHSREVRLEMERAQIAILNVESAVRGFQLTGHAQMLDGIASNERMARAATESLAQLIKDNPAQEARLRELVPLIEEKFAHMRATLTAREDPPSEAPPLSPRTLRGEQIMELIRAKLRAMGEEEDNLLQARSRVAQRASNNTLIVVSVANGLIIGLLGLAFWTIRREFSARRRAAELQAGARAYAESIVDTVREPLLVLDREARVERANRAFCKFFGTACAEIEGRSIGELGDGRWTPPQLPRLVREALAANQPFDGVEWEYEQGGADRRTMLLSGCKLYRPGNHTAAVLVAFEDITERRRAEQIHLQFRALFESIPGLYLVLTRDLQIAAVSDAYLKATMTTREEVVGRELFAIFTDDPEDAEASGVANLAGSLNRVRESGRTDTMAIQKYSIRRPDGSFEARYWSPVNSPVIGVSGQIEYIIHRVEDVTDFVMNRKQRADAGSETGERMEAEIFRSSQEVQLANQQLRALNSELEAFSYSVSHDLRAPLRHIDGFADLLNVQASDKLDDKGRRYLRTISDSAKRMGTLIDDLLAFSRLGRTEMRRVPVEFDALTAGVMQELESETKGRTVVWKKQPLPVVVADPALLRQVLVNLLSNALKYSRPRDPAVIEISCEQGAGETIISVRDNGVGFEMAYAHKLFGVFQRLHRADEFEGTGVGLANVRRIIARHGGRTWAESRVGEGAIFYVSLPTRVGNSAGPTPTPIP